MTSQSNEKSIDDHSADKLIAVSFESFVNFCCSAVELSLYSANTVKLKRVLEPVCPCQGYESLFVIGRLS